MRVSQDADTYRARSVLRRDYRATRGLPEVPRAAKALTPVKHPEHTISCDKAPDRVHVPERFVVRTWRLAFVRKGDPWVRVTQLWAIHCRYCHTRHIAIKLLGPVADLLDREDIRRLLASAWCQQGHLFEETPAIKKLVTTRWGTYNHTVSYAEKWCVMCGRSSRFTHHITDPALLAGAGVPTELLAAVQSRYGLAREPNPTSWARNVTFTEEPVAPSPTTSKRARRRKLPATEVPAFIGTSS